MRNPFSMTPGGRREPASAYHEPTPPSEAGVGGSSSAAPRPGASKSNTGEMVDLQRRRDQLSARVAELQWDLGGLVYEMAIRDRMRVDVLVKRAAILQDADAELNEVERILRSEQTGTAGVCTNCGAPHSSGAVFCWQCGHPLLEHVSGDSIVSPSKRG
jgi:chorismate mutase